MTAQFTSTAARFEDTSSVVLPTFFFETSALPVIFDTTALPLQTPIVPSQPWFTFPTPSSQPFTQPAPMPLIERPIFKPY